MILTNFTLLMPNSHYWEFWQIILRSDTSNIRNWFSVLVFKNHKYLKCKTKEYYVLFYIMLKMF